MSTKPLVSVVIPCFNAARTIEETVRSVARQTWRPLELIVVDDGSSDSSVEVVRAMRLDSLAVHIVSQPNRGQGAAFNRGLELAKGEYVQLLDADDLLAPTKIEAQLRTMLESGLHVSASRWARFRSSVDEVSDLEGGSSTRTLPAMEWLEREWFEGGGMLFPARWLLSRDVLATLGPWSEDLTLNIDGEYFSRLGSHVDRIGDCADSIAYYRSGQAGSMSGRLDRRALESGFSAVDRIENRLATDTGLEMRRCIALMWLRFAFGAHPYSPDLSELAAARARELDRDAALPIEGGWPFRLASSLLGWRFARRLQRWTGRT